MKKIGFPILLLVSICLSVLSCNKDDSPTTTYPPVGDLNLNLLTPTPRSGPVGTVITITGQNFSTTPEENTVMIGNTLAPVISALPYAIKAIVPEGATTGVISVTVGEMVFNGNTFTVTEGTALSKSQLTLYPYPHYAENLQVISDTGNNTLNWSSSDETVATVDENGLVTPLKIGSATITVTIENNTLAECVVNVLDGPVTKLELNLTDLDLHKGDMETLSIATLEAEVEQTGTPIWSSEDETVATVDQQGNVTAVGAGTATITLTVDNATATCTVSVFPNIYVAGYQIINGIDVATLWKNDTAIMLSDGSSDAKASSVSVDSNENVYVVGYEFVNGVQTAMLWRNGNPIELSNGVSSRANSIFVNGAGITFVAGSQVNNNNRDAMLWRNQVANIISDGSSFAEANDVFVDGADVYLVGVQYLNGTDQAAKLWKNDQDMNITDGSVPAQAHSVFVENGKIYIAGEQESINGGSSAFLWEDGQPNMLNTLFNYGIARSVTGDGTKLYVAGTQTDSQLQYFGTLWTNGTPSTLADSDVARSVFLHGTDIYVTGFENTNQGDMAKIWINGVPNTLGSGYGNSVFVK